MTGIVKVGNTFSGAAGSAVKNLGLIVEDLDAVTKLMKIVKNSLEMTKRILGKLNAPLNAFCVKLGETLSVLETFQFFSYIKTVCCKDDKGEYFFKSERNSRVKKVGMACLGVTVTGGFIAQGEKFGFYSLGRLSKAAFCRIPILSLVIRSASCIYKIGSLIECKKNISSTNKNIITFEKKIDKWNDRSRVIKQIRDGEKVEINKFAESYKKKIEDFEGRITSPKEDVVYLANKIALYKERLRLIEEQDYAALAGSFDGPDFDKQQKSKVNKYTNEKVKAKRVIKENQVGVIESISKIAAIVLSLIAEAFAYAVLPLYLTYMTLSLISDAVGIARFLMKKRKVQD